MIALFIFFTILLFLIWVFIAPIIVSIDTQKQLYQMQWKGIANAVIIPLNNDFFIRLHFFFWKKDFYPLHPAAQEKQKKKQQKKKKPVSTKQLRKKGARLIKSFELKKFKLNLDTDDYIQNSYLYPVFYFLNNEKRQLTINYRGDSELQLEIQNRLYKILVALFL